MPDGGSGTSLALAGLVAFLIGNFPSGMLVCRFLGRPDPAKAGSCNVGATNVFRTAGPAAGLWTLGLDLAKGWLAVALATGTAGPLAALAVVLGHVAPPWPGLKGGKGVATAAGAFGALAPWAVLPALAVFGVILAITRVVAIASLSAVASFPVFVILLSAGRSVAGVGILVAVLVAVGHRGNLKRIREGREPTIGRNKAGGRRDGP